MTFFIRSILTGGLILIIISIGFGFWKATESKNLSPQTNSNKLGISKTADKNTVSNTTSQNEIKKEPRNETENEKKPEIDSSLPSFNKLTIEGEGEINIVKGDSFKLKTEGSSVPSNLYTRIFDDTLVVSKIQPDPSKPLREDSKPLVYTITTPDKIQEFRVAGSGKVKIQGDVTADNLHLIIQGSGALNLENVKVKVIEASIAGSGNINSKGSAGEQRVLIQGSGNYFAKELVSKIARVSIGGSGNATINAQDELNADIGGSGKISYLGNPVIDKEVRGSGELEKINS